jgi:hypothetical protein
MFLSLSTSGYYVRKILESKNELVEAGLLMPAFLAKVNPTLVRNALKKELSSEEYKGKFRYSPLVHAIEKRMQRARFEEALLDLAYAYRGYTIYFPA